MDPDCYFSLNRVWMPDARSVNRLKYLSSTSRFCVAADNSLVIEISENVFRESRQYFSEVGILETELVATRQFQNMFYGIVHRDYS